MSSRTTRPTRRRRNFRLAAVAALAAILTAGATVPAQADYDPWGITLDDVPTGIIHDSTPTWSGHTVVPNATMWIQAGWDQISFTSDQNGAWSVTANPMQSWPWAWQIGWFDGQYNQIIASGEFEIDATVATPAFHTANPTQAEGDDVLFQIDPDSEVVRREWSIDGSPWTDTDGDQFTIPSMSVGTYNVVVRAYDGYGNVSGQASSTVTVDARIVGDVTPPYITLANRDSLYSGDTNDSPSEVFFVWADEDSYRVPVEYRLDGVGGDPWLPVVDEQITFLGLSNGEHVLEVQAFDDAGNRGSRTFHWIVDVPADNAAPVAPAISWVSRPAKSGTAASARFAVNVPQGAQVEYVLDLPEGAQAASPVAVDGSEFTLTGLSVGHHKIQVSATLNGAQSTVLTYEWDVTAPSVANPTTPGLSKDAIPADLINNGIRQGAHGDYVKIIQAAVGADEDGFFGPRTKAAVIAFQRAHGLEPDGIVGPLTWAAIVDASNSGTGTTVETASSTTKVQAKPATASDGASPKTLPITGGDPMPLSGLAVSFVLAGGALVLLRRRQTQEGSPGR